MSGNELTVVLLPGATTDADALAATLASVRAEIGDDGELLACREAADLGHEAFAAAVEAAGVPLVAGSAAIDPARTVGFVRLGDRWVAGALAARRRPLQAHPTAVLSVAAHRRVPGGDGDADGVLVPAPMPPVEPAELLLRPRIEASAVLARRGALDAPALTLLHRPHGDAVVWSRVVGEHGHLPSGEVAAEVRLDPDRHGFRPEARIDALLAAVAASGSDDDPDGLGTVRRELLRRLFIEAEGHDEVDVLTWVGPAAQDSPRARGVVADLSWALRRQREALVAERVTWPAGRIDRDELVSNALDLERIRLATELAEVHAELRVRDAEIRRLQAEIVRRDREIRQLEGAAA